MKILNRIKRSEDFATVIHKGRSFRLTSYIIHVYKNELGYARVGISASAKLGNAVVRNRIKRQVRAICDQIIDYEKLSLDIVIVVRKEFLDKTFSDNKSLLSDFINKQAGL